jgi:hypothetical protein
MHIQQVALAVLAFSSAHGGTMVTSRFPPDKFSIIPPSGNSRIIIERDPIQLLDEWIVHVFQKGVLKPPMYFPPVHTEAALEDALARAWEFHLSSKPPPHLSRSVEPFLSLSPPRSASLPRLRTGASRQSSPRPE